MDINLLILGLILAFTLGYLAYNKKLSKFRRKKSDFFNYLLTLMGTLLGVFLAIYFTNLSEYKKEQKNVTKQLNGILIDVNQQLSNSEMVTGVFIKTSDSMREAKWNFRKVLLEIPEAYNGILQNELILKHLTGRGTSDYIRNRYNMNRVLNKGIPSISIKDPSLAFVVSTYVLNLENAESIIKIERNGIRDNLSIKIINEKHKNRSKHFKKMLDSLYKKHFQVK